MTFTHKLLSDRPDPNGKGKNPRVHTYLIETEGLGSFETSINVPTATANLKNAVKKAEKIKALLAKKVEPQIAGDAAAHAG